MTGFGGVISFEIDGDLETASRFVDRLKIPYIAASMGGIESLVEQPPIMSYFELDSEQRLALGIRESLVRFAVGIEDPEDLIQDTGAGAGLVDQDTKPVWGNRKGRSIADRPSVLMVIRL